MPTVSANRRLLLIVLCCLYSKVLAAALPITLIRTGECRPEQANQEELFPKINGETYINVLVTRFSGHDDSSEKLGSEIAANLASRLDNFMLSNESVSKPDELSIVKALRVRYMPCYIAGGHDVARRLGQEWGADLVFWGQASCPVKNQMDCHLGPLSIQGGTFINNGNIITQGKMAPISIDSPNITIKPPTIPINQGAFKTSLTVVRWHRLETVQHSSISVRLDPKNIQDLDFPRIASAEPMTLFRFMIGVYAFLSARYSLASDKFLATESAVFAKAPDLQPLHEIMGISHLYANREQQGIRLLVKALQLCYLSTNTTAAECQIRSLTNLGWAYAKRENYQKALEYYAKAAELIQSETTSLPTGAHDPNRIRMTSILYNNIGYAYMGFEDFEKAYEAFEKARRSAEEHNIGDILVPIYSNIGYVLMRRGDDDGAETYLTKALEQYQVTLKDTSIEWKQIQDERRRQASGMCAAYSIREFNRKFYGAITRNLGDAGGVVPIYINLSTVLMRDGRLNTAKILLDKALSLVSKMGDNHAQCTIRDKLQAIYSPTFGLNSSSSTSRRLEATRQDVILTDLEMRLGWREKAENEKFLHRNCRSSNHRQ